MEQGHYDNDDNWDNDNEDDKHCDNDDDNDNDDNWDNDNEEDDDDNLSEIGVRREVLATAGGFPPLVRPAHPTV